MNLQKALQFAAQMGLSCWLTACSLPVATPAPSPVTLITASPQPAPSQTHPASPSTSPSITPRPATLSADEFSPDSLDEKPPAGILEEIAHLGLGGGSDIYCNSSYLRPDIASDPEDTELMRTAQFVTCGWPAGKHLSYKVILPGGRAVKGSITTTNEGQGSFAYAPGLDDPEGVYIFEISAPQLIFSTNVLFKKPTAPRFYRSDPNHFLFINFQPRETLKLFVYDLRGEQYVFRGWQSLRVDDSGRLLLDISAPDGFFFVQTSAGLGVPLTSDETADLSFEINRQAAFANQPMVDTSYLDSLTCPVGFESRLDFTGKDKLELSLLKPDWLRANPRANSRQVIKLAPGQAVVATVFYPTVCNEGKAWRKVFLTVKTANGSRFYSGYLVEIDEAKKHFLVQSIPQPATATPVICPGSLKSRLTLDMRARVAFTDGTNMRIRIEAGFSQKAAASVPEGTLLTILGGPTCVDSVTWWRIRTKDAKEGWMAEYQNGVYLLEPYSW